MVATTRCLVTKKSTRSCVTLRQHSFLRVPISGYPKQCMEAWRKGDFWCYTVCALKSPLQLLWNRQSKWKPWMVCNVYTAVIPNCNHFCFSFSFQKYRLSAFRKINITKAKVTLSLQHFLTQFGRYLRIILLKLCNLMSLWRDKCRIYLVHHVILQYTRSRGIIFWYTRRSSRLSIPACQKKIDPVL